jgi:hypothetical protein
VDTAQQFRARTYCAAFGMKTGRCLCSDVAFEYDGAELFAGHCHCDSCRRQTASPFTTFMGRGKRDMEMDWITA